VSIKPFGGFPPTCGLPRLHHANHPSPRNFCIFHILVALGYFKRKRLFVPLPWKDWNEIEPRLPDFLGTVLVSSSLLFRPQRVFFPLPHGFQAPVFPAEKASVSVFFLGTATYLWWLPFTPAGLSSVWICLPRRKAYFQALDSPQISRQESHLGSAPPPLCTSFFFFLSTFLP